MNKQIKLWQSLLSTVIVAALILGGVFFYVGKLRSGVEQLYDGAQQLADGSNQIEDGLSQVNDGTGSLNDGLSQYTDGVAQVDEGLGTLADGLGTYTSGVAQVDNGLGTLQSGLKTYTGGAASIKSGTDTALSAAAIPTFATFMGTSDPYTLSLLANQIVTEAQENYYGTATLYGNGFVRANVFGGDQAEMDRVMGDASLASDEATAAATSAAVLAYLTDNSDANMAAMSSTKPFAGTTDARLAPFADMTTQQIIEYYGTSCAKLGAAVATGNGTGMTAATGSILLGQMDINAIAEAGGQSALLAQGSQLVYGATYTASNTAAGTKIATIASNKTADRAKRTFADASCASYPKLIAGLAVMYKAIYDVNQGSAQMVAANDQLLGGVKALKDGTGQLTANNSTIMDGLSQLKDGTGQLVANNDALLSGSSQLSDGSGQLYDGSQTLSDGLATLVDGVHTLLVGVGGK